MPFLHPYILGGLAAIGIPLAVHWLTRPRPTRLPLSTIRFIFEAVRQRRARHRLRDAIVLTLRAAAVALIVLVIARPFTRSRPLVAAGATSGSGVAAAMRVVLLDASQSMAAVSGGSTAFDRARPAAARFVSYEPGLHANVIVAAARPRAAFERPSSNFAALRDELDRAAVAPERLDVQASINAAAEMLGQSVRGQRRELVIVSDFQRSNWSAVDFSPLPKDARIQLESVAPPRTPDNLAILAVNARGRAEQAREARVEVEVGNFSEVARQVTVELSIGSATARMQGACPARGRVVLATDVMPASAGWQSGEARLVGADDALAADNVRPFVLDVRPPPAYALITRQLAADKGSSSQLLERALLPIKPRDGGGAERAGGGRVVRVGPDAVDRDAIAAVELIVLDHPGKLAADKIALLSAALRRGRAILYFAGEPVDATNLKLLAEASGSDLKMPVEFFPPAAADGRRDLFWAELNAKGAPFSVFGDGLNALKSSLRFSGGLSSRQLAGGLADDVLATYGDRTAAVVVTACGAGTLGVLNADLGASNLPSSTAFVPLLGELADRLIGERRTQTSVNCGEALVAYLPPDTAGLSISGPDGSAEDYGSITSEDAAAAAVWRWPAAGRPGVYAVHRGDTTVHAMAVCLPAEEADLTSMDGALLTQRLAGGRQVHFHAAGPIDEERRDDLWAWLAVTCTACLIGEVAALKVFRT